MKHELQIETTRETHFVCNSSQTQSFNWRLIGDCHSWYSDSAVCSHVSQIIHCTALSVRRKLLRGGPSCEKYTSISVGLHDQAPQRKTKLQGVCTPQCDGVWLLGLLYKASHMTSFLNCESSRLHSGDKDELPPVKWWTRKSWSNPSSERSCFWRGSWGTTGWLYAPCLLRNPASAPTRSSSSTWPRPTSSPTIWWTCQTPWLTLPDAGSWAKPSAPCFASVPTSLRPAVSSPPSSSAPSGTRSWLAPWNGEVHRCSWTAYAWWGACWPRAGRWLWSSASRTYSLSQWREGTTAMKTA